MKKTIAFLFMILLGMIVQVKAQSLSPKQIKSIESQIDSSFNMMLALAEKFDYDQMNQGVDDHHKAGFLVNEKYYADYATLIAAVKTGAQGISEQKIVISEKKITVLSNRIALLTTHGISTVNLTDGREFSGDFYWSFVYEKIDGEWKVIQSHQSRGR